MTDEPRPSFTCPRCSRTSHHPKDAEFGYCGACHDFTGGRDAATVERGRAERATALTGRQPMSREEVRERFEAARQRILSRASEVGLAERPESAGAAGAAGDRGDGGGGHRAGGDGELRTDGGDGQ